MANSPRDHSVVGVVFVVSTFLSRGKLVEGSAAKVYSRMKMLIALKEAKSLRSSGGGGSALFPILLSATILPLPEVGEGGIHK